MEQKISKAAKNMLHQIQHAYGEAISLAVKEGYNKELVESLRKKHLDTKCIADSLDKGEVVSDKIISSLYRHLNTAIKNYATMFVNAVVDSLKESCVEESLPGQLSFDFKEESKEEPKKLLVSYVRIYSDDSYDYIEKLVTQEQYESLCDLQKETLSIRDLKILYEGGE